MVSFPVKIEQVLETSNDEIRFMLSGVATERENYNFSIPVPVSGAYHPSVARATLCYFPTCNRNQGVDYTDTELDLHFGRIDNNGRIKSLHPTIKAKMTARPTRKEPENSYENGIT